MLDRTADFTTRLGPVFANFVLADEVNRAPAKVQSALLEVMAEGHASIAGETHPVPRPFLVLATQNPIESEGVYALPEAQLDRFAMKLIVDYPTRSRRGGDRAAHGGRAPRAAAAADPAQIMAFQETADAVFVDHRVRAYAVQLVNATRNPAEESLAHLAPYLELGGSPRASLSLVRGAKRPRRDAWPQLRAARGCVLPVPRRSCATGVILTYEALAADVKPDQVLDVILGAIPQPHVELGAGRAIA